MRLFLAILLIILYFPSVVLCAEDSTSPPLKLQNSKSNDAYARQPTQRDKIRDIRGPIEIPNTVNYIFILAAIILLLLTAMAFYFFKKRKNTIELQDPGESALAQLQNARSLLTEGNILIYAERLSEILRHYIEDRFHIHSTRQTTSEFLQKCSQNSGVVLMQHKGSLKECLENCDMAKFAHSVSSIETMERMEASVEEFIVTTTPTTTGGN